MCDYSLQSVRSRSAKVGDRMVTRDFGTGTQGFASTETREVAICLLPGTEIAFSPAIAVAPRSLFHWLGKKDKRPYYATAIFRQVHTNIKNTHHDAVEFPDGTLVLLTALPRGRYATVLQLPARPTTPAEAASQRRVTYVG